MPELTKASLLRVTAILVGLTAIFGGAASILALGTPAEAQTGANVLVVTNRNSVVSETIGRQYAAKRDVPPENLCTLQLPLTESVSREVYDARIEEPIWNCMWRQRAYDRILYIVLTKDVPIRIIGTSGRIGAAASVDSELTLLYRRRRGDGAPVAGFVPNPYFAGTADIASLKPFNREAQDIYLVTRLDGYTLQDALALIDRGTAPAAGGRFVLDQRSSPADTVPNRWLSAAAERLKSQGLGDRVVLDETATVVTRESQVIGYYSAGSNDDAIRTRTFDLGFLPGALAGLFASTDAHTFEESRVARPRGDRPEAAPIAGTSVLLTADLVRAGVTGASGNVDEPYLDATIRPDILFPAYASGRTLAEAFYAAMPYLSWQTIIIGDPLCAPFSRGALRTESVAKR